jgi:hypothetical protein
VSSAFLLLATKQPGSLPPRVAALAQRAQIDGLSFRPTDHVYWQDDSRALAIGAWQGPPSVLGERAWCVSDGQLVTMVGHSRWVGGPRRPRRPRAAEVADALQDTRFGDVIEQLEGVFSVLRATSDGEVSIGTDPLGFRCIYYAETPNVVVVSSRAWLVASALAVTHRPMPDALNTAWFAYTTYRIGDASGFDGVRTLPSGGVIAVQPGRGMRVTRDRPWMPDQALRERSVDDVVDLVRCDIRDALCAALEVPVDRHIVQLTGGKDSRLVLAVAHWAGLADAFEYETIGPPDLEDVRVASELANLLGLRHEVKFLGLGSEQPYADRLRGFVATTEGMLNIWDLAAPNPKANELRVVGLCGEMLRTYRRLSRPVTSSEDLHQLFRPQDFGRLRLLYPHVVRRLHADLLDVLFEEPCDGAEPLDLFDAYYFRNRVRFSRTGPLEDVAGQLRVMPLYSLRLLRAAFALGGEARQTERLHYEVIRRCSELLTSHRFAGPGWDPRLEACGPSPLGAKHSPLPRTTPPALNAKAEPLMAGLQRKAFDERKNVLLAALRGPDNRAWDSIDRAAAAAALERFHSLGTAEKRELYGAVTAALWLDDATRC